MNYWDSSALLKLYVRESDTHFFLDLISSSPGPLISSDLARVEVLAALQRKEHMGELPAGTANQLYSRFEADARRGRLSTLPIGSEVLREANRLLQDSLGLSPPVMLRSLDAIHLASARTSGSRCLVSTDVRQRAVALAAGLSLVP